MHARVHYFSRLTLTCCAFLTKVGSNINTTSEVPQTPCSEMFVQDVVVFPCKTCQNDIM